MFLLIFENKYLFCVSMFLMFLLIIENKYLFACFGGGSPKEGLPARPHIAKASSRKLLLSQQTLPSSVASDGCQRQWVVSIAISLLPGETGHLVIGCWPLTFHP